MVKVLMDIILTKLSPLLKPSLYVYFHQSQMTNFIQSISRVGAEILRGGTV